jgi:ATP-dependent DNA ligase
MLYAFDLLELDSVDLRGLPPSDRKKRLAGLLGKRRVGIVLSEHTSDDDETISAKLAGWASRASFRKSSARPIGRAVARLD